MLQHIDLRDVQRAQRTAELEIQMQQRTLELSSATQKHISWLENLAQFLRHELRNTTIGVKTSLDLIERRSGNQAPVLSVYIERARKSIVYMNNLLESVSHASTLEASFQQNACTDIDLSELVRARVNDYRTTVFPDHKIRFECPQTVVISGNTDRLIQLLDNLITNATEHCKPGTPICVQVARRGATAELVVTNQGDRLPEHKMPLFELFVSMKNSEQQQSNAHLGLGLYLVKLIAELHGGAVAAEDPTEAEGALFRVSLPLPGVVQADPAMPALVHSAFGFDTPEFAADCFATIADGFYRTTDGMNMTGTFLDTEGHRGEAIYQWQGFK
jgi:signal transduction histidine kinase